MIKTIAHHVTPVLLAVLYFVMLVASSASAGALQGKKMASQLHCMACHGERGDERSAFVPKLAGQKRNYLSLQLRAFRQAAPIILGGEIVTKRVHRTMQSRTTNLTDRQIEDLAAFYSGLTCKSAPRKDRVPRPDRAKTCEICHGGHRTNPFRSIPTLASQKETYLIRQLEDISKGIRSKHGSARRYHRLMEVTGHKLTDHEIKTLAHYFAGVPCRRY